MHKYVRIARIVLEDKLSDAFNEICDILEEENPLPEISEKIQDAIPVIGSYFKFETYEEASKKVTTLLTIPIVLIPILIAFFTILVVACKCLCCTKCQICMASCGCSLLCALALIIPVVASLPNAFIQPNMDAIQNELQSTSNEVLKHFTIDPVEIDLPKSSDYVDIKPEKLKLKFGSIEELLESSKFTVTIKINELVKKMIEDNDKKETPDPDDIQQIIKNHVIKIFEKEKIDLVFDLSKSNLNKIFSSETTPVLDYFNVKGNPAGTAFEAKLGEIISKYFTDESFFEFF